MAAVLGHRIPRTESPQDLLFSLPCGPSAHTFIFREQGNKQQSPLAERGAGRLGSRTSDPRLSLFGVGVRGQGAEGACAKGELSPPDGAPSQRPQIGQSLEVKIQLSYFPLFGVDSWILETPHPHPSPALGPQVRPSHRGASVGEESPRTAQ